MCVHHLLLIPPRLTSRRSRLWLRLILACHPMMIYHQLTILMTINHHLTMIPQAATPSPRQPLIHLHAIHFPLQSA
jgi:hypothetical protein